MRHSNTVGNRTTETDIFDTADAKPLSLLWSYYYSKRRLQHQLCNLQSDRIQAIRTSCSESHVRRQQQTNPAQKSIV